MLFENRRNEVTVLHYEDRKTVERKIKFKKLLAEEVNVLIAVFNKETLFKLNNSILVNIAMNNFFKQLEKLSEEEAIGFLIEEFYIESKK